MKLATVRPILLVAAGLLPPVGTAQAPKLPPATDTDPQLTEQLRSIEKRFCDAILQKDANVLASLVAPDFTLRVGDVPQSSLPRAIWMDNALNKIKGEWCGQDHLAARKLSEDLAAVSLVWRQKATTDGRDFTGDFYLVDLWKKSGDTWQIVARYSAPLAKIPDRPPRQITPPTDMDPQLTEQLRQLEQQFGEATMRRDPETVDRLLGADFTLRVGDDPERSVPRAVRMENLRAQGAQEYKTESFEEQYHAARKLTDSLAVISLLLTQKATFAGRDRSGDFYVADIWKKNGDDWKIIARYSTPIGKKPDKDPAKSRHSVIPLPPHMEGLRQSLKRGFEVVSGDPDKPGAPFVIRIYNVENQVVQPHWHPEDEHITVVRGTWYVGDGDMFDRNALREANVGEYVFVPKEMRHYAWSEDATIVQIHGIGPFKQINVDSWMLLSDPQAASHFKFKLNDHVRSQRGEGVVVFGVFSEKNKITQYFVEKKNGDAFAEWETELEKLD
jgi:ketosteroid isomerase-like protein